MYTKKLFQFLEGFYHLFFYILAAVCLLHAALIAKIRSIRPAVATLLRSHVTSNQLQRKVFTINMKMMMGNLEFRVAKMMGNLEIISHLTNYNTLKAESSYTYQLWNVLVYSSIFFLQIRENLYYTNIIVFNSYSILLIISLMSFIDVNASRHADQMLYFGLPQLLQSMEHMLHLHCAELSGQSGLVGS